MTHDRYGERQSPSCRDPRCRRGWIGHDDEGRPIPCLACKPHLATTTASHDFAVRIPSARAQQAINAEENETR